MQCYAPEKRIPKGEVEHRQFTIRRSALAKDIASYNKLMARPSKSAIDRAGRVLASSDDLTPEVRASFEAVLDDYRRSHLEPLTSVTIQLQKWLAARQEPYYIAQRLKRKPQILRKLRRLSGRLVQMQDIAGARIVVKTNSDVNRLREFLRHCIDSQNTIVVEGENDYRLRGREISGYRALHLVLGMHGHKIELQLRSEAQHYWAEQIERTSVIYGHHLKELEGHDDVLAYFKVLSDIFHEFESLREPTLLQKVRLDEARERAEAVIRTAGKGNVFDSSVSEDAVAAMVARQSRLPAGVNNWIIVFNWNTGSFVHWEIVDRDSNKAIDAYIEKEQQFPTADGYEVVMVGSSHAAMIRHTHSHYFGIENYDSVLETLEGSIAGISKRLPIGIGSLKILRVLLTRRNWSPAKIISSDTLKNHFCKSVVDFEDSLQWLVNEQLVIQDGGGVYLNIREKARIEAYK